MLYILLVVCSLTWFVNQGAAGLQLQSDGPYENLQKNLPIGKFHEFAASVVHKIYSAAGQTGSNPNFNASSNSISAKTIDWRRIISRMMEVQCTRNTLVLLYRYNTRHARLMGDWHQVLEHVRLSFLNLQNCTKKRTKKISNGQIMISIDMCDHPDTSGSNSHTFRRSNFTLNAFVEDVWLKKFGIDHLNEYFNVSCLESSLLGPVNFEPAHFVVTNSVARHRELLANFSVGDKLSFYIQLSNIDSYSPADLQTFPVNCWMDDENSSTNQQDRRYFLEHGCPAKDQHNRGLSSVSHFIDGYATKITLRLTDYLIDPILEYHHAPKSSLILKMKCEVVLCTNSRLNGVVGIPMCPLTTYCSSLNDGRISVPKEILLSNTFTVKSDRIIVDGLENVVNSGTNRRLKFQPKTACICPNATSATTTKYDNKYDSFPVMYEVNANVGISPKVTFFAAAISFLSGAAITAMLWYSRTHYSRKSISSKFHELSGNSIVANNRDVHLLPVDPIDHSSSPQEFAAVASKDSIPGQDNSSILMTSVY